jgi:hypothetical protein
MKLTKEQIEVAYQWGNLKADAPNCTCHRIHETEDGPKFFAWRRDCQVHGDGKSDAGEWTTEETYALWYERAMLATA